MPIFLQLKTPGCQSLKTRAKIGCRITVVSFFAATQDAWTIYLTKLIHSRKAWDRERQTGSLQAPSRRKVLLSQNNNILKIRTNYAFLSYSMLFLECSKGLKKLLPLTTSKATDCTSISSWISLYTSTSYITQIEKSAIYKSIYSYPNYLLSLLLSLFFIRVRRVTDFGFANLLNVKLWVFSKSKKKLSTDSFID